MFANCRHMLLKRFSHFSYAIVSPSSETLMILILKNQSQTYEKRELMKLKLLQAEENNSNKSHVFYIMRKNFNNRIVHMAKKI